MCKSTEQQNEEFAAQEHEAGEQQKQSQDEVEEGDELDDLTEEELRLLEEELAAEGLGEVAQPPKFNVGDRVSIFGVKSRPELNGDLAFVVQKAETEGRWVVKLPSGEEISLKEDVLTAAPMKDKKKKKGKDKKKQSGSQKAAATSAEDAESALAKEMAAQEARRAAQHVDKEKAKLEKGSKVDAVASALKEAQARKETMAEEHDGSSTKDDYLKAKRLEQGAHDKVGIRSWKKQENHGDKKFIKP